MQQISRVGTFTGTITESVLGETQKGYPQAILRLQASKYYAQTKEELAHYQLTEPGYVDYPEESITAFSVLFNDNGPLKNYEQLVAIGWDGQDFETLSSLVGKPLLFRVEEHEYNGKVSLQVNWLDTVDAPPERTLKALAPEKAKALNSRFLGSVKKPVAPPVKASKAVSLPPKAAPAAATTATAPTTTTTQTTPAVESSLTPPSAAPKRKKVLQQPAPTSPAAPPASATPVSAPSTTPPAATHAPVAASKPDGCTKIEAWEAVNAPAIKGDNDDDTITDAWLAATNEIGANVDESAFTPEMWAAVRDTIRNDLGA